MSKNSNREKSIFKKITALPYLLVFLALLMPLANVSCSVKDNSDNIIGTFCADAGLVSVMPYQEALKYNPEIEERFRDSGEATIIRNFTGKVYIRSKFDIENKEWIRYVEGNGIINSTESLKFTSYQSGY